MAIKFNSTASRYSATAMGIAGKNVSIRTASAKASAAAKCATAAKKNVSAKNMVTAKNSLAARSSATKTSNTKSNQSSLAYKAVINSGKAASSSKKLSQSALRTTVSASVAAKTKRSNVVAQSKPSVKTTAVTKSSVVINSAKASAAVRAYSGGSSSKVSGKNETKKEEGFMEDYLKNLQQYRSDLEKAKQAELQGIKQWTDIFKGDVSGIPEDVRKGAHIALDGMSFLPGDIVYDYFNYKLYKAEEDEENAKISLACMFLPGVFDAGAIGAKGWKMTYNAQKSMDLMKAGSKVDLDSLLKEASGTTGKIVKEVTEEAAEEIAENGAKKTLKVVKKVMGNSDDMAGAAGKTSRTGKNTAENVAENAKMGDNAKVRTKKKGGNVGGGLEFIELSKSNIQHIKKHTFDGMSEQAKYLTDEQLAEKLANTTFFNKNWSQDEVVKYTQEAYNTLRSQGKTGLQSIEINGEIINVFIKDDGTFDTAYGVYKYTVDDFK